MSINQSNLPTSLHVDSEHMHACMHAKSTQHSHTSINVFVCYTMGMYAILYWKHMQLQGLVENQ